MLDIHSHIIPRIDDGSDSMSTSIIMAEMAVDSGVSAMIATPHCNQAGRFENYVSDSLLRRFDDFREEMESEGIDLEIGLGMEIFCTPEVPELLKQGRLITLNGSRYALVEFGFRMDIFTMERMLFPIMEAGYVPVIAHPERYHQVQSQPEVVFDWMQEGMVIQINKGSIFGRFGRDEFRCANNLLRNGLVSCIASDAHGSDSRTTDMADVYDFLSAEFSEEEAELLLEENPRRIFENKHLINLNDIQFC